jgi:hypothetical protein
VVLTPRRFQLDVDVTGQQGVETAVLAVGEEVGAGVEHPAGIAERVGPASPMAMQLPLEAPSASVDGVTGEADRVERVHERHRDRELLARCGLQDGETVGGYDVDAGQG